jgi:formylglycine-generating enzyme required for sulfatase activity
MIDVGGFCVDETEVTNAEYAAWLASGPDLGAQPAECAFNSTFVPQSGWPASGSEASFPVVYVDWCDAYAFCAQTGKRLCGHIGGGALDPSELADATVSQWFFACTSSATNDFPYGDAYSPTACNGADLTQPDKLKAVKQMLACRGASGPFSDVYDMSGNVHEWEDACSATSGSSDACRLRGGSYKTGALLLRCDADTTLARGMSDSRTGFRCCAY